MGVSGAGGVSNVSLSSILFYFFFWFFVMVAEYGVSLQFLNEYG